MGRKLFPGRYLLKIWWVEMRNRIRAINYHLMLLPGIMLLVVFSVIPMFGVVIAFQNFIPAKGILKSAFVGLDNFTYMFQIPDSRQVFANTLVIACLKILAGLFASLAFALLLNEMRVKWYKRAIQTIVYLPHFISWVILSGIIINLLTLDGLVNQILKAAGLEPVMFLGNNTWFRIILVVSDVWKSFGYGAIVYLAALTAISPTLYEASVIDGANRRQQLIYITLPGIASTVVLLATLSLGNVLNAGFDQIFNLYNPTVYQTADIIDTYVYRMGLIQMQYGLATAVGLLKSVVSFILIILSYKLAYRFANYRIF